MSSTAPSPRHQPLRLVVTAVTVLVGLAAVFVYGRSATHAAQARQFDDWWSRPLGIYHFTGYQVRSWLNWRAARTLRQQLDDAAPDARQLRLEVRGPEFERIAEDPQAAFGRDFEALLDDGLSTRPVELRLRGDTSAHWTTEKVSFTLRTPKDEQWRGHQQLGFSCKRVLEQYVSGSLARDFDLLSPWTTVAPVYLNGSFHGIYRVLELVDESFLRRRGKIPGNIHRGDTAERGEVFKNVPRALMRNPYIWDRVAKDGAGRAAARARIEALVRDLHDRSPAGRARLWSHFDRDEISRLFALMLVLGDSYHMSDLHNHFWYQDPTDQRLHPIPWDLYVRSLHEPISTYNLLLKELLRDPAVLEGALLHVRRLVTEGELRRRVHDLPSEMEARFADAFEHDRLRRGWIPDVGSADHLTATLLQNLDLLERWSGDCRVRYCVGGEGQDTVVVDLMTEGLAGADLMGLSWDAELATTATPALRLDQNRNGRLDPADPAVPASLSRRDGATVLTPSTPLALMAGANPDTLPLQPTRLAYRIFLVGEGVGSRGMVQPLLRSRLTGAAIPAGPLQPDALLFDGESWHPWDNPARAASTTRWSGDVTLDHTISIPAGDRLVIEPGTTIRMAPDVSIVARGRVEAAGTATKPIAFVALGRRPWGTVALLGDGADGSTFSHCEFRRGGGATVERIECKGMVTVLNSSQVTFSSCRFDRSTRCDDTLHAARSEVSVVDCLFTRNSGDSIDFEGSGGEIRGCRFERPANDAIDLMTSHPLIIGNTFSGCGDKGISVGEMSSPLIFNNVILDGSRGIEVREGSEPRIVHNTIEGNEVGLRVETEYWRYGVDGVVAVTRSRIRGNDRDLKVHRDARVAVAGSVLGSSPRSSEGDVHADLIAECMLAEAGISSPPGEPGATRSPTVDATGQLVEQVDFRADFERQADDWRMIGAARKLAKKGRDLVAVVGDGRGGMEADVAWDAAAPGQRHVLLLEVAAPRCHDAVIEVEHEGGVVATPIPAGRPDFLLVAVELGPQRHSKLRLLGTAGGGDGQIILHGYQRYVLDD